MINPAPVNPIKRGLSSLLDYIAQVEDILNFKGYENHIIGLKVTVLLVELVNLAELVELHLGRVCSQWGNQI